MNEVHLKKNFYSPDHDLQKIGLPQSLADPRQPDPRLRNVVKKKSAVMRSSKLWQNSEIKRKPEPRHASIKVSKCLSGALLSSF